MDGKQAAILLLCCCVSTFCVLSGFILYRNVLPQALFLANWTLLAPAHVLAPVFVQPSQCHQSLYLHFQNT